MNTVRRILCYGDSNTWGFSPADGHRMDGRWTRQLDLPFEAEIVEEGLNSRTAVCKDPHLPEKCGFDMWKMMLLSHQPLDLVVLMLGTNDLKSSYHCSARYIANGLREYVREWMNPTLYENGRQPQLLVVTPLLLRDHLPVLEGEGGTFDAESVRQSGLLAKQIHMALAPYPVEVLDAADFAQASDLDGLHMTEAEHDRLAVGISQKITEMLESRR